MAPPKKSLRPKARPQSRMRPKARPFKDVSPRAEEDDQEHVGKKAYGGKMGKKPVAKKKSGGSCRGMGAASRGGRYSRSA